MLTTILIAITVDTTPTSTFHQAAVASFLKGWEETLPIREAQDIRWFTHTNDELADLCNRKALGELDGD